MQEKINKNHIMDRIKIIKILYNKKDIVQNKLSYLKFLENKYWISVCWKIRPQRVMDLILEERFDRKGAQHFSLPVLLSD